MLWNGSRRKRVRAAATGGGRLACDFEFGEAGAELGDGFAGGAEIGFEFLDARGEWFGIVGAIKRSLGKGEGFSGAAIDDVGIRMDFAHAEEFEERAGGGGAVEGIVWDLDEPIHLEFGNHWRLGPGFAVAGNRVLGIDLCRVRPLAESFKRNGTVDIAFAEFFQKPDRGIVGGHRV